MHRALERQLGASKVDLDSEAGWVRFAIHQSTELNFHQIETTLKSANYELYSIEVVVAAEYRKVDGKVSAVLAGSGQEFPLEDAEAWAGTQRLHALAEGWRQFEPRLRRVAPSSYGTVSSGGGQ